MTQEIITSETKSFDNILHRLKTLAPKTFRTPISLVRCSATKEANPNNPKQEMNMARLAKKVARFPMRSSPENFCAYSSSVNLYWKGLPGLNLLKTGSNLEMASLNAR